MTKGRAEKMTRDIEKDETKQLQDEIKVIEAESTLLVQERENIDIELESFNLNEIRGKCNHIEIEIYELVVLDY